MEPLDAAPEDVQLGGVLNVVRDRHRRLRVALERPADREQVAPDPVRDPVEHDRRDHLVRADGRLHQAGDSSPDRGGEHRAEEDERNVDAAREAGQLGADRHRGDHADQVLALTADVEEPGAESERHGEGGEDQRGAQDQRLLQVDRRDRDRVRLRRVEVVRASDRPDVDEPVGEPRKPGPVEDSAVDGDRIPSRCEHDEAADEEGDERRDDRRDDASGPLVEREPTGQRGRSVLVTASRRVDQWQRAGSSARSSLPRRSG